MLARGQYCAPRGGILLSLATTDQQVDTLAAAFDDVLAERRKLFSGPTDPLERPAGEQPQAARVEQ
jgi:hypothetical protein